MQGIYEIVNLVDGKATAYVGSSVDIKKRCQGHRRKLGRGNHDNQHLQSAWVKYGASAFAFNVVEEVDKKADLLAREQHWLDRYFEMPRSIYNIARDASASFSGLSHSDKTRRKISNALKGKQISLERKYTDETRRKIGKAHKGRSFSDETRRRMGEAKKGKPLSKEHRRKLSEAHKGKSLSAEHSRKAGEGHAKPYPAFVHRETGETISSGVNLARLCRERGLANSCMYRVANGQLSHHKGWILATLTEVRERING